MSDDVTESTGEEGDRMSVWEHISELRKVVVRSLLFLAIGVIGLSIYAKYIYDLLLQPLREFQPEAALYTHSPPEAFVVYLKIALVGGLVVASPFIVWQLMSFVMPGLKDRERRWLLPVLLVGLVLFSIGVIFAYYVVVPLALRFLWEFNLQWDMEPLWRVNYYFNFILVLFLVFGGMFELPLVVSIFARIGIASPEFLRQQRKYAIVGLVAGAAILTPPDVITQVLLAIPLWLLYEISILLAAVLYPYDH